MAERLTIGQMAKLNHVSEQTLRLYDKFGIFSPKLRDEHNHYRYYDIRQSAVLDIIQYLKSLGMSLKEIRAQLQSPDVNEIEASLRRRHAQIDEEIRSLHIQQRAIRRTIESFERYRNSPPCGMIVLEYIGKRELYRVDTGVNFYEHGIEMYENMLRKLQSSLMADGLPQSCFYNAGTILRREHLLRRDMYSTEVFVFLEPELIPEKHTETIPAGCYLCIYCDDFHKEAEYAARLLAEVERQGCRICGDYLCEVLAEIPMMARQERGMFFRLQIPVEFCNSML